MRLLTTSIVALLLMPVHARAQSGVLIGLAARVSHDLDAGPQDVETFRTVWITHEGPGQARVAARLPALVVPRRDGFWRVGLTSVCEASDGGKWEEDRIALWAARLTGTPVVDAGPRCGPLRPEPEKPLYELYAEGAAVRCSYQSQSIHFVSAEYISTATHSARRGWCDDRGWQWTDATTVMRFDGRQPVSYESSAGRAGLQLYTRAIAQGARDIPEDFSCLRDADEIVDDSLGWSIERGRGRWKAMAFMQPGNGLCQYGAPIDGTSPAVVTGHDTLALPWAQIVRVVPDATDAFSSPQRDTLIVAIDTEMQVFELAQGVIGRRLMTFTVDGDIVMIQWALGANVARWTKTLTDAARSKLPAPAVRRGTRTP